PQVSADIRTLLGRNVDRSKLARLLPSDARVEHKSGWYEGVANDAGIVTVDRVPTRWVIAVFSENLPDAETGHHHGAAIPNGVHPLARLEHQVRLRMDAIRKGVVAALLIDPRGMAVLEVRRRHGGSGREDPLVEHVVQNAVAHRDALSLLAMACAQPEQREVHAMRDRVILGTQRDEPVTARHAPARG